MNGTFIDPERPCVSCTTQLQGKKEEDEEEGGESQREKTAIISTSGGGHDGTDNRRRARSFRVGGVEKSRLNSPSEPNAYSDSQIRPVGTR